jgi:hypothetical protein
MKNKNVLIGAVVVVVLLIVMYLLFRLIGSAEKTTKVTETQSGQATITQAYVSVSAYGVDSNGDNNPDKATIQYSPLVNISTTKDIASFQIVNVKLTNPMSGEKVFVTWPKHYEKTAPDSNTFYEPMATKANYSAYKHEGNSFSYKVVNDVVRYTDEISKNGGYVDFRYTIYGMGNLIDYEGIMNTHKIYSGGKELQYAGFEQGELNSPIEFDVVITFTDKTKAVKHFSLTTDFAEVYQQGFSFKYNSSEYEGKSF